jgi:hypothetical protein
VVYGAVADNCNGISRDDCAITYRSFLRTGCTKMTSQLQAGHLPIVSVPSM